MRRWVFRILACLILGAITTVAVAWAVALSIRFSASDGWFYALPVGKNELAILTRPRLAIPTYDSNLQIWNLQRRSAAIRIVRRATTIVAERESLEGAPIEIESFRWLPAERFIIRNPNEDQVLVDDARGWPLLALRGDYVIDSPDARGLIVAGSGVIFIGSGAGFDQAGEAFLPFHPIWPGFAIDTLFYAAIWGGVFFGFTSAKRAIRRKRGRCPRCGYDLRGQRAEVRDQKSEVSDSSAGCPECGWNRQEAGRSSEGEVQMAQYTHRFPLLGTVVVIALLLAGCVTSPLHLQSEDSVGPEEAARTQPDELATLRRELSESIGESTYFETRPVWPRDQTLRVLPHLSPKFTARSDIRVLRISLEGYDHWQDIPLWPASWMISPGFEPWSDSTIPLGVLSGDKPVLLMRLYSEAGELLWADQTVINVRMASDDDELLKPVPADNSISEALQRPDLIIRPMPSSFLDTEERIGFQFDLPERSGTVAVAVRLEFLYDGVLVAHASCWNAHDLTPHGDPARARLALDGEAQSVWKADPTDARWRVRIVGDPNMALRDFGADSFWDGKVELPLADAIWKGNRPGGE